MQTNWESFIIVRDKIFHVKIRFFLVTCLFVLLRCLVQFHFVIIIIGVDCEKGNLKLYFSKDSYLKIFT